jgi:hypothetical protein
METKVLIGIPTGEYGRRADFWDYMNQLDKRMGTMIMSVHGQSPARSRNLMIEQAIVNNCSHLLFIDDDMAFKANSLEQLLVHDKDIVSGLYLGRMYPHNPLIFDEMYESGSSRYYYLTPEVKGLVKVVAAGLGFCLVKTEVFHKMEKPWIRLGELDKDHWCDDIGFFKRAREAGIEVWCDTDCRCGHIGSLVIWPQVNDQGNWLSGYDTGGQTVIGVPAFNPGDFKEAGIMNAMQIEGWMSENELRWLAKMSKDFEISVEFGSHCGRSTRAIADNTKGVVYAVDPWTGQYMSDENIPSTILEGSRWYDFCRNMKDVIDIGRVIPCRAESRDFYLHGDRADFVFLDGDHRYDNVIEDIGLAKNLVKPGGIIAGHDYGHPGWPGVQRAVDELYGDKPIGRVDTIWWVKNE